MVDIEDTRGFRAYVDGLDQSYIPPTVVRALASGTKQLQLKGLEN